MRRVKSLAEEHDAELMYSHDVKNFATYSPARNSMADPDRVP